MIVRVVKMTFDPQKTADFLHNFENNKEYIRAFEGCHHLELLQEIGKPNVYFTYSWWDDESSLEKYRHSQLFKEVWSFTKSLFSEKPKAWSLHSKTKL